MNRGHFKGFSLYQKEGPAAPVPNVSVDVIPGIPGVQSMIAAAEAEDRPDKKKDGAVKADDTADILKFVAPAFEAFIPGISLFVEAFAGGSKDKGIKGNG